MQTAKTQALPPDRDAPVGPWLWIAGTLLFGVLLAAKLYLGARLDLFGDGAFYWLESRHPAISYSDVPFLTPLMVGLGTALVGDTVLGARILFIALGSTLPVALYWLARPITGHRDAVIAALFGMLVPVPATMGLLIIPDVPLLILSILTLGALERATRTGNKGWWIATGAFAALAFNAHYRFAFFALAVLLYLTLTREGRAHWRQRNLYIATGIALIGLAPVLWFNLSNRLAGVAFHFVDRHPWAFDPQGLFYLVTQAIWVTPILFAVFALTLWHVTQKARQGTDRAPLMIWFPAAYLVPFTLLSPWAVGGNSTTGHWSLFAYIPLLIYLPATLRRIGRLEWIVPTSGVAFMALVLTSVTLAAHYPTISDNARRLATDKLSGWPQVGAATEAKLTELGLPPDTPILTDTYYLSTQLAHTTKRTSGIYNLDSDKIFRHGRAVQRAIWGFDEAGLRRDHAGTTALVVIERGLSTERLCAIFERLRPVGQFDLFEGERLYRFFIGETIKTDATTSDCIEDA